MGWDEKAQGRQPLFSCSSHFNLLPRISSTVETGVENGAVAVLCCPLLPPWLLTCGAQVCGKQRSSAPVGWCHPPVSHASPLRVSVPAGLCGCAACLQRIVLEDGKLSVSAFNEAGTEHCCESDVQVRPSRSSF